jgi:hypothetical protein
MNKAHQHQKTEDTARRLFMAELALHDARSSRVDEWIKAAANNLHEAVADHLAALGHEHASGTAA